MPTAEIRYFGAVATVMCDGKCNKAWGVHSRPFVCFGINGETILTRTYDPVSKTTQINGDMIGTPIETGDFALLADAELGEAPADPGTYECDQAKPKNVESAKDMNRWCYRECERSILRSTETKEPLPFANPNRRHYQIETSEIRDQQRNCLIFAGIDIDQFQWNPAIKQFVSKES